MSERVYNRSEDLHKMGQTWNYIWSEEIRCKFFENMMYCLWRFFVFVLFFFLFFFIFLVATIKIIQF